MTVKFEDVTFDGGRVSVDGSSFERCVFNATVLVYSGGEFPAFSHCSFNGTNWFFDGPAGNTVQLIRDLYQSPFKPMVERMVEFITGAHNHDSGQQ